MRTRTANATRRMTGRVCVTMALLLITGSVQAQINAVWISGNSGDITDTANWVDGVAGAAAAWPNPFSSDDSAIIGSGTAQVPNQTIAAAPLTIESGATLLGNTGNSFRPSHGITNHGTLRYAGSGTFTMLTGGITNTGTIENTGGGTFTFTGGIANTDGSIQISSGTLQPGLNNITAAPCSCYGREWRGVRR